MKDHVTRIEHHMSKTWIRENPEIAINKIMENHKNLVELGMVVRIEETKNYYDMIGERG